VEHVGSQCHLRLHYGTIRLQETLYNALDRIFDQTGIFRGVFSIRISLTSPEGSAELRWGGGGRGAQRHVLPVNEPIKTGALSARARSRGQNSVVEIIASQPFGPQCRHFLKYFRARLFGSKSRLSCPCTMSVLSIPMREALHDSPTNLNFD
jgi:hypothetical protein